MALNRLSQRLTETFKVSPLALNSRPLDQDLISQLSGIDPGSAYPPRKRTGGSNLL